MLFTKEYLVEYLRVVKAANTLPGESIMCLMHI